MVTDRTIKILDKEYITKGILKDGLNYISPKVLSDAGFVVSSRGSEAVIDMNKLKVNIRGTEHNVTGINSNGKTYVALRELLELIGLEVGWEDNAVTIK